MPFTYSKYFGQVAAGKKGVIWSESTGPIRATLVATGAAYEWFGTASKATQNRIIATALVAGGNFWIRTFLPMRFTQYARKLGYKVTKEWEDFKRKETGDAIPLVGPDNHKTMHLGGQMRDTVLKGARAAATVTSTKTVLRIKMPLGHAVQVRTTAVLHRVPPWELQRIAEVIGKAMADILSGSFAAKADGTINLRAPVPIPKRGPAAPGRSHRGPAVTYYKRIA